jgi:hypothetical protein
VQYWVLKAADGLILISDKNHHHIIKKDLISPNPVFFPRRRLHILCKPEANIPLIQYSRVGVCGPQQDYI